MWWLFIMNDDVHFFFVEKIFFPILQKTTIHDNDDKFCKDFFEVEKKNKIGSNNKKKYWIPTHTHTYYYRLLLLETFPLKKKIFFEPASSLQLSLIYYTVSGFFFFIIANLHTNKKKREKNKNKRIAWRGSVKQNKKKTNSFQQSSLYSLYLDEKKTN